MALGVESVGVVAISAEGPSATGVLNRNTTRVRSGVTDPPCGSVSIMHSRQAAWGIWASIRPEDILTTQG